MPQYQLRATDGATPVSIDTFEANDAEEAITLSTIRLERRDMELATGDQPVAHFSKDGRLTRSV